MRSLTLVTLAEIVAHGARQRPDTPAILAPGRLPLSYARLHQLITDVSASLAGFGLGRDSRIAVVLPNGPELATAFVSIGAAAVFAPLNPEYREAEFDYFLTDLHASALLVWRGADSPARDVARKRSLAILELAPDGTGEAGAFTLTGPSDARAVAPAPPGPAELALLLHTSGTSSRPKRVPLTQAHLCRGALNTHRTLSLTPSDRCLNVMPLFHIHGLIGATLSSLAAGASLICTSGWDTAAFFDWLEAERPTWYTAVPTIHQAVLAGARERIPPLRHTLRFIRSSSAPLPPPVLRDLERVFQVPVIEAYGMTEAAHEVCSNPLPPGVRKTGSVGLPAGVEVAVMDDDGRRLGAGAVGEIVIRGPNVVAGDGDSDPEPTAGDGWFRTGDHGYRDDEGYLFLTGRIKELINRGGEKVSPRDVEEALLAHAAVGEAAAFAVAHDRLGEDVAAAVVLRPGTAATERDLRQVALERLAPHKVPSRIVPVTAIPHGPTGKVLRIDLARSLAALLKVEFVGPRTPAEEIVARAWCEALEAREVGVLDNFFHRGGDSLTAARLIARLRDALAIELPVDFAFQTPTVAEQALAIERKSFPAIAVERARLIPTRGPRPTSAPLSFAQERIWLHQQISPGSIAYNCPAHLQLRGRLDPSAMAQALDALVARHEALRTTVAEESGRAVQSIQARSPISLPLIDRSGQPDARTTARQEALEDSRQEFDLERGPLLRARLIRVDREDYLLSLTFHHFAFDAWSKALLLRELPALYEKCATGHPPTRDALPIQYADFATWERAAANEAHVREGLAYWKARLSAPSWQPLPTECPSGSHAAEEAGHVRLSLAPDVVATLHDLARAEQATVSASLLAAYATLIHRYSGHDDVLVGCPVASREFVETEDLIGLFINTLPIRLDFAGDPPFREVLRQSRMHVHGALRHQHVPLQYILRESVRDSAGRSPLLQALFVYEHLPLRGRTAAGVAIQPLDLDTGATPADLSLELQETEREIAGCIRFRRNFWSTSLVERIARRYETLVESIVANPDCIISRLTLLPEPVGWPVIAEGPSTGVALPLRRIPEEVAARVTTSSGTLGQPSRGFIPPQTSVQTLIAHVWRELLNVDRVGLHDNFFALGGHSLLAMRALSHICDAVGVELPLSAFFDSPTLEDLALAVKRAMDAAGRDLRPRFGSLKGKRFPG
jgi:acyl-CoA synthetase (AMP-forming)/AMP-acid ligase II/acyl carrier protein